MDAMKANGLVLSSSCFSPLRGSPPVAHHDDKWAGHSCVEKHLELLHHQASVLLYLVAHKTMDLLLPDDETATNLPLP